MLKFFGDEAPRNGVFEFLHAQAEALEGQLVVSVAADKGVAIECIGNQLADAIGAFLIGDADAETDRFEAQRLVKHELVQHLLSV